MLFKVVCKKKKKKTSNTYLYPILFFFSWMPLVDSCDYLENDMLTSDRGHAFTSEKMNDVSSHTTQINETPFQDLQEHPKDVSMETLPLTSDAEFSESAQSCRNRCNEYWFNTAIYSPGGDFMLNPSNIVEPERKNFRVQVSTSNPLPSQGGTKRVNASRHLENSVASSKIKSQSKHAPLRPLLISEEMQEFKSFHKSNSAEMNTFHVHNKSTARKYIVHLCLASISSTPSPQDDLNSQICFSSKSTETPKINRARNLSELPQKNVSKRSSLHHRSPYNYPSTQLSDNNLNFTPTNSLRKQPNLVESGFLSRQALTHYAKATQLTSADIVKEHLRMVTTQSDMILR